MRGDNSFAVPFADVVNDKDDGQALIKNRNHKFMVVGLWRFENNQYICYRMFRILTPFYTCYVGREENTDVMKFLYEGDNKQLFYISK